MEYLLELFRWLHVFFGIVWIGHLYFFNFVNGPFEKNLDASFKKTVIPALRGRALWWFRWGAMVTFITGVLMILMLMHTSFSGMHGWFTSDKGDALTGNWWITLGSLFGTIMWFNVWFVIWPRQQQILTGIATGNKPATFDAMVNTAGFASRLNTRLSVPLIFCMVGSRHAPFPAGNVMWNLIGMAVVTAVGMGAAHHLIGTVAGNVGKEFVGLGAPAPAAPPPAAPPPPAPAPAP